MAVSVAWIKILQHPQNPHLANLSQYYQFRNVRTLQKSDFLTVLKSRLALWSPQIEAQWLIGCCHQAQNTLYIIPGVVQTNISYTVGQRMMSGIIKYCSTFTLETLFKHSSASTIS